MTIELSRDEQVLKARLLGSAALLDDPTPACEANALSRLMERQRQEGLSRSGRFYRIGAGVAVLAVAASIAVSWRPLAHQGASRVQALPEQVSASARQVSLPIDAPVPVHPVANPPSRQLASRPPLVAPARSLPSQARKETRAAVEANTPQNFEQSAGVGASLEPREVDLSVPAAPSVAAAKATLVVWDGDHLGLSASGWTGPTNDKDALRVLDAVGFDNSRGLRWKTKGDGWLGFGWNLFSWYPKTSGIDVSAYAYVSFRIRIEAPIATEAPLPSGFLVTLSSSGGTSKRSTGTLRMEAYAPSDLTDGKWHSVKLPLAELLRESQGFDPKSMWEFDLGHWAKNVRQFTVYVDDIAFE